MIFEFLKFFPSSFNLSTNEDHYVSSADECVSLNFSMSDFINSINITNMSKRGQIERKSFLML